MTTSSAALASAAPEAAVGPEGAKAVEVKLSAAWDHAYAGEWLPVTFDLLRPAGDPCPVRLDRLTCADDDVQLDVDLLQPGVEIRPGERYRFTAGLRVGRPKLLDLGTLSLWFKQQGDDERAIGQKVSTQKMTVRAFIGNEIDVRVEPLYRYKEGEGTKVLVTLTHQGESPYSDLTVSLGPEGALRAGKRTTQMLTIRPGDEELLELVVAGTELELLLAGSRDGDRSEARVRKPIDPPAPPAGRRFRFLEPRRLARDQHRIYQLTEDGTEGPRRAVREQYGVYLLEGGSQYLVEIRPNQPGARDVRLNEIAGLLQIRKSERTEGGGGNSSWRFPGPRSSAKPIASTTRWRRREASCRERSPFA
jgi:hypothetical protein